MREFVFALGIASTIVVMPCAGQAAHVGHFDVGVAAFAPTTNLGELSGFRARVANSIDIRVGGSFSGFGNARIRVGADVVPATRTTLEPMTGCVSRCSRKRYITWIVSPGADVIWPVANTAFSVMTGVGFSIYAHPGGECADSIQFCANSYPFTENAARPTIRVGMGYRLGMSRLSLETRDFITPVTHGQVQNDIRVGAAVSF